MEPNDDPPSAVVIAQAIRRDLKAAGFSGGAVGVAVDRAGGAVTVTIKRLGVPLVPVETIALRHQVIAGDARGEVVEGWHVRVHTRLDPLAYQRLLLDARPLIRKLASPGDRVKLGPFLHVTRTDVAYRISSAALRRPLPPLEGLDLDAAAENVARLVAIEGLTRLRE